MTDSANPAQAPAHPAAVGGSAARSSDAAANDGAPPPARTAFLDRLLAPLRMLTARRPVRRRSTADADRAVIGRYLDISTGHLRSETCEHFELVEGIAVTGTAAGWLACVPECDTAGPDHDYDWPSELLPILEFARRNRCDRILFDADGPFYRHLDRWDW